jgi:hypothetical protein
LVIGYWSLAIRRPPIAHSKPPGVANDQRPTTNDQRLDLPTKNRPTT